MIAPEEHLCDEQLDDLLMEIAEPAVAAHAASCAACSARLAEFRGSLAAFNQASLAWSEARSNTLTRDLRSHRLSPRLTRTTLWSCASAGMVAVALLFTVSMEHRAAVHGQGSQVAAGMDYASSRQQEIASDNAMLAAISSEIDRPTTMPSILNDGGRDSQPRRGELRQARD